MPISRHIMPDELLCGRIGSVLSIRVISGDGFTLKLQGTFWSASGIKEEKHALPAPRDKVGNVFLTFLFLKLRSPYLREGRKKLSSATERLQTQCIWKLFFRTNACRKEFGWASQKTNPLESKSIGTTSWTVTSCSCIQLRLLDNK